MSTPAEYDLALYRGDTRRWQFVLWADAAKTDPVDLVGATAAAMIRDRPGGTLVGSMDCSVTAPNIIDMALTSGGVDLPPRCAWDLQVTYASGDVITIMRGDVAVTLDVTYGNA